MFKLQLQLCSDIQSVETIPFNILGADSIFEIWAIFGLEVSNHKYIRVIFILHVIHSWFDDHRPFQCKK